ncbi:MAG: hypothetical protein QM527_00790 [Alphaproteobacteria bacterium]|nr:hypothetical protein [Alphaproteobacteria bacterium]MDI9329853.1 hypothetical protein [Alphaproteobacteria bacterium]
MSPLALLARNGWLIPWVCLLGLYAAMGWLDPTHWLGTGLPQSEVLGRAMPLGSAAHAGAKSRPVPLAPAPWPDEAALRRLLAWHGLSHQSLTLGSQRAGQTEVRLVWRFSGAMGPGLAALEALAIDSPHMAPEALNLQFESPGLWRFEWRGVWRQAKAPEVLPERPLLQTHLRALGASAVFDPDVLRRQQARLWVAGASAASLLTAARPEHLHLIAVAHDPNPQAWVAWQQQVLLLRVGDRVGPEGARVQTIERAQVRLTVAGRTQWVRPRLAQTAIGSEAP